MAGYALTHHLEKIQYKLQLDSVFQAKSWANPLLSAFRAKSLRPAGPISAGNSVHCAQREKI